MILRFLLPNNRRNAQSYIRTKCDEFGIKSEYDATLNMVRAYVSTSDDKIAESIGKLILLAYRWNVETSTSSL